MSRPRSTTDEQILAEARACFLEHGPGISTTVIASRLGISHAVLFQRFGSKEQLMRAALLEGEPSWHAAAEAGPDERPVRTQLLELAEVIYASLQRLVPCVAVLRAAGVPMELEAVEEPAPVRSRRVLTGWFTRASERGLLSAPKPEHAADLLIGALQFRPFYQHISRQSFAPEEDRAYLEFCLETLWKTLAPRGAR